MSFIFILFPVLVALEAFYIMYLEMFGSIKAQAKAFEIDPKALIIPEVKTLLGNQGVYNGLLGLLIIATILVLPTPYETNLLLLEMAFVLIAAIYGGFTASRKIWLVQGLPAVVAILMLLIK